MNMIGLLKPLHPGNAVLQKRFGLNNYIPTDTLKFSDHLTCHGLLGTGGTSLVFEVESKDFPSKKLALKATPMCLKGRATARAVMKTRIGPRYQAGEQQSLPPELHQAINTRRTGSPLIINYDKCDLYALAMAFYNLVGPPGNGVPVRPPLIPQFSCRG
ncbi:hypothetical protein Pelo_11853 [Pelomyxa schiedti]|nr:hypothetical protein Pelo_11853 [Pelomyxa schiedti]